MMIGEDRLRTSFPPFSEGYRSSGVLLHVTSLPSAFGIGDVGPSAFSWIDRLYDAGQGWWQSLPLGPTTCFNSPYQSLSSFAGNWLLVSPDFLMDDGLLSPADLENNSFTKNAVEFDEVILFKYRLLEKAWNNFRTGLRPDLQPAYEQFRHEQAEWLEDYALFRALKVRYGGIGFLEWPKDLLHRDPSALARAGQDLAKVVEEVCFAQFILHRQGNRLKEYAHAKGVRFIGDLPFFVSLDSSDVWVNPELFLLDEQLRPRFVAGVPPDYFSKQGQMWGNPVYDWEALSSTDYQWCIRRIRALLAYVDIIRLDHFRGFEAAWHIPADAPTAQSGEWVAGPRAEFFDVLRRELGGLPFIAEDLGLITPEVRALRDQFQLPGTRVLQFAFDGHPDNPHLSHNYVPNTVVYTGTHDNNTTRGWFEELPEHQRKEVWIYLKRPPGESEEVAHELIRQAWSSVASLAMVPLQDLLSLGKEARMNVPGCAEGNWRWRATEDMLSSKEFEWLGELTRTSNRSTLLPSPKAGR